MIKELFASLRPEKPQKYQTYYPPQKAELTAERAAKRGLSIEDYLKRVAIVSAQNKTHNWKPGDTGMPALKRDRSDLGKCMVVGVVTHFDDYGTVEWSDKTPFIIAVSPLNDRSKVINCTPAWLVREHLVEQDAC